MDRRRRLPPPPWRRGSRHPKHPTGRAERRWPQAYDGGYSADIVQPRYRRAYDGDRDAPEWRRAARGTLDTLRRSPVRNGLIGLAVAGTAAPIAVNRHQQALRTDPDHESMLARGVAAGEGTDDAVTDVWRNLETTDAQASAGRERMIEDSLSRYAEFNLTRELAEAIYDAALANDIEPEVAFGLVRAESSFKNTSTSTVGAIGLTQLMPGTAKGVEPGITLAQLRSPDVNLRIGFKYLRSLVDKYEGDTKLALLAYNRGPGTVDRELRNGRDPDNGYADFVFGKAGHGHTLFTRG